MTDIDTPPRIILLGATGYTGDLTARSLIAQGARPMLVAATSIESGRSPPSSVASTPLLPT